MTGTSSSSARSDKSGKNKNLSVATVKDEFASSERNSMFGQEGITTIEHDILKENHEILIRDYESLQERIKHVEESYDIMKKHLQSKPEELEVTNTRLLEDCERVKSEKEKYKKMFEEMKTMESERKATIDELRTINQELLMARRKGKEEVEKMENKFVELAERFGVVETECSFLKSLYDAEVAAASGTATPVMSKIGETENLIGHGGNQVNDNVNNNVTDSVMVSEESDDEHDNPPRESNISTQRPVDRSQEEQCNNREDSLNGNQALGETFTPRAVNRPLLFPASSLSSSSSSSSSDGYDVVVKLPANWPDWAIPKPKGPGNDSNKS